jgi:hypothetical protein
MRTAAAVGAEQTVRARMPVDVLRIQMLCTRRQEGVAGERRGRGEAWHGERRQVNNACANAGGAACIGVGRVGAGADAGRLQRPQALTLKPFRPTS